MRDDIGGTAGSLARVQVNQNQSNTGPKTGIASRNALRSPSRKASILLGGKIVPTHKAL